MTKLTENDFRIILKAIGELTVYGGKATQTTVDKLWVMLNDSENPETSKREELARKIELLKL